VTKKPPSNTEVPVDVSIRAFATLDEVCANLAHLFNPRAVGPPNSFLRARPLRLAEDPELVAETGCGLVFTHHRRHLVQYEPGAGAHLRQSERTNLWWAFRADLVTTEGAVAVRTVEVGPWPPFPEEKKLAAPEPFRGLSAEVLRAIRPGWIVREALEQLAREETNLRLLAERGVDWPRWEERRRALEESLEAVASKQQKPRVASGGPPRRPDEHYEAVAVFYLELYEKGLRHGIHDVIAQRWIVAPKTAAHWILEARRRGFLAKGSRGRVEARPGPRLRTPERQQKAKKGE
jgi:hypothetical protein